MAEQPTEAELECLRQYFAAEEWRTMSTYVKQRHYRVRSNYYKMLELGIPACAPLFMTGKKIGGGGPSAFKPVQPRNAARSKAAKKARKRKEDISDSDDSFEPDESSEDDDPEYVPSTSTRGGGRKRKQTAAARRGGSGKDKMGRVLQDIANINRNLDALPGSKANQKAAAKPQVPRRVKVVVLQNNVPQNEKKTAQAQSSSTQSDIAGPKMCKRLRPVNRVNYTDPDENVDFEVDDEYTYCDECQKMCRGFCNEHLILYIRDSAVDPAKQESMARQSLPSFMSICKSKMKGAGWGVWTEVALRKGCVFGPYQGEVLSNSEEADKSGYSWAVKDRKGGVQYVDAQDENKSNWMRFINSARTEDEQSLVAFQYKGRVYYKTYKEVLPYTELLVWYGEEYSTILEYETYLAKGVVRESSSNSNIQPHQPNESIQSSDGTCPWCQKEFKKGGHLQMHIHTHTGQRPFVCDVCHVRFIQELNLIRHKRLHTGEKRFRCDECGARFAHSNTLLDHTRTHTGEKPYTCDICGRGFSVSSALSRHLRTHSGDKPYACRYCPAKFAHSSARNRHERTMHDGRKTVACGQCGWQFSGKHHLAKHAKQCTS